MKPANEEFFDLLERVAIPTELTPLEPNPVSEQCETEAKQMRQQDHIAEQYRKRTYWKKKK